MRSVRYTSDESAIADHSSPANSESGEVTAEILAQVVLHAIESEDSRWQYYWKLWTLRGVCRSWRVVIDHSPVLWRELDTTLPYCVNAAAVERSEDHPLVVRYVYVDTEDPAYRNFSPAPDVACLLLSQIYRWQSAEVTIIGSRIPRELITQEAPLLEDLTLLCIQAPYTNNQVDILFNGHIPALRCATLAMPMPYWHLTNAHQLRSLELQSYGPLDPLNVLLALSRNPHLAELRLQSFTEEEPSRYSQATRPPFQVRLDNLVMISCKAVPIDFAVILMRAVQAPLLRDVGFIIKLPSGRPLDSWSATLTTLIRHLPLIDDVLFANDPIPCFIGQDSSSQASSVISFTTGPANVDLTFFLRSLANAIDCSRVKSLEIAEGFILEPEDVAILTRFTALETASVPASHSFLETLANNALPNLQDLTLLGGELNGKDVIWFIQKRYGELGLQLGPRRLKSLSLPDTYINKAQRISIEGVLGKGAFSFRPPTQPRVHISDRTRFLSLAET